MFRTKVCITFMPPLCRLPSCLYSSSHQDLSQPNAKRLVLTVTLTFPTLHRVVWFQLLVAETEMPTLIFSTARKAFTFLHDTLA